MLRLAKHEGVGNVVLEEVPMPEVGPRDVLVRVRRSLISRGSELGGRYLKHEAVDPSIMGYAAAGEIAQVGEHVAELAVGDPVAALKPHAQFVVADLDDPLHPPMVVKLPPGVSLERGTFWPFGTSGVMWAITAGIRPGDTVVVVGQGLVGCAMTQIVRRHEPGRVIAVDALPLRCAIAARLGADEVVDASATDPVAAVRELTGERGAEVVIEAVGGSAGPKAFPQVQDMVAPCGTILLLGLYQGEPLPLDAGKAMGHRILGGWSAGLDRAQSSQASLDMLASGSLRNEELITHRFHCEQAREAFDLLAEHPETALGVILEWD